MVFFVVVLLDVLEFCDGCEFGIGEGVEVVEVQLVDGDVVEEVQDVGGGEKEGGLEGIWLVIVEGNEVNEGGERGVELE